MINENRFWSHVIRLGPDDCWVWKRPTKAKYPCFLVDGKNLLSHRVSFEIANGRPVKTDLTIDHLCRNKQCVNPSHLEEVSIAVNVQRSSRATKTHCIRGHLLSGDNLYRVNGRRHCRECRRIRGRISDAKRANDPLRREAAKLRKQRGRALEKIES